MKSRKKDETYKRYFPPLYPMPYTEYQYEAILLSGRSNKRNIEWNEFLENCQKSVRNENGEQYGKTENGKVSWFVRRMISNVYNMGIINKFKKNDNEYVYIYTTGEKYLKDNLNFSEFLWYSIKRGWVLQKNLPEGIEVLKRIFRVIKNANKSMKVSEIKNELNTYYDFNPNRNDLQEFLRLLSFMGAIKEDNKKFKTYSKGPNEKKIENRLIECDIFKKVENILSKKGANTDILSNRAKRDLAKYYMYRESGGWGKQGRWFNTFFKEYIDIRKTEREIEKAKPKLFRHKKIRKDEDSKIKDDIYNKFSSIKRNNLKNLTTDELKKIRDCETSKEAHEALSAVKSKISRVDLNEMMGDSDPYSFSDNFNLWKWQEDAVNDWYEGVNEKNHEPETGILQVVTGAGKTIMAMEVIRRWLKRNPNGIISVIVPTKVLMYQWLKEFASKLHVPAEDIGWLGDGQKDKYSNGYKIIVSIVNSAVKGDFLKEDITKMGKPPHLFIADECHRYTGDVFQKIFECPRAASLGLSATPIDPRYKDDMQHDDSKIKDEIILKELGPIFYELTYKDARKMNIIPKFRIHYVGIDLTKEERIKYDKLTRELSENLKKIEAIYGNWLWRMNGNFDQKLKYIFDKEESPHPSISKYFVLTQERRRIVDDAVRRQIVSLRLLEDALENERKVIVFQEKIKDVKNFCAPYERRGINPRTGERSKEPIPRRDLYDSYDLKKVDMEFEELFSKAEFKPVMYHTGHSQEIWNSFAIEWFSEHGFANVMLSVKALIEGIDVPNADMGLVRVSTSSLRQRIQTLGRVLRNPKKIDKTSHLYIIYARNTIDERLFKEFDWGEQLGNAEINYEIWEPNGDDFLKGYFREASPDEYPDLSKYDEENKTIDVSQLKPGDIYPGRYEGYKISVDSRGKPFEKTSKSRKYITNSEIKKIAQLVFKIKRGGKIAINENGHVLTILGRDVIFLGVIDPNLKFTYEEKIDLLSPDDDLKFENIFES